MNRRTRYVLSAIAGILVLIVIVMFASNESCNSIVSNDPQAVAAAAVSALPSRDDDKILRYFTPPAAGVMEVKLAGMYGNCEKFKIVDLKTYLLYETDITARVKVEYGVACTNGNKTIINKRSHAVKLIKNSDNWLINEAF